MENSYVSYKELKERAERLVSLSKELPTEEVSKYYLKEHNKLIFDGKEMPFGRLAEIPSSKLFKKKVYRVSNYPDINVFETKSFAHPLAAKAKLGRCNLPNHPAFYFSNSEKICFAEILQDITEVSSQPYYLSEWEINPSKLTWSALSFTFDGLNENNYLHPLMQQYRNILMTLLKANGLNDRDAYIKLYHDLFTTNNYSFSSIVAHSYLYTARGGDIVMYPSCASNKAGINFAFRPKFVYDGTDATGVIILNRIYEIAVVIIEGEYQMKVIDIGTPYESGKVTWGGQILDEHENSMKEVENFVNFLSGASL